MVSTDAITIIKTIFEDLTNKGKMDFVKEVIEIILDDDYDHKFINQIFISCSDKKDINDVYSIDKILDLIGEDNCIEYFGIEVEG